ncbi:MAG: CoA transferase [Candidatus Obscuribacter sp.]|nr:CoA transferase [Candidatus Obscuribacter sp.]
MSQTPLIEIEKIADGKPVGLKGEAAYPLSGIRVIDFTHVLAGPRSMRSLAQYGAEVLHISSPYHRDTVSQNLLVNMGKRSAYLLLTEAEKLKEMKALTAQADVFACSYRPSVEIDLILAQRLWLPKVGGLSVSQSMLMVTVVPGVSVLVLIKMPRSLLVLLPPRVVLTSRAFLLSFISMIF